MEILALLALGLAAGALGGMMGIGGSIIMIPVLTLLLKRDFHIAQAVAMIVNVFVALPAALAHHRARAIQWKVVGRMAAFGVAFILLGVEWSNRLDEALLKRVFGVFLLYVVATNIVQLIARAPEPQPHQHRTGWWACGFIGACTGLVAGLLGVGGGIIAVPLLQRIARLPLRQCIATTAAFMCITASIGALRKNLTLSQLTDAAGANLGLSADQSLLIASVLAPTAVLGGLLGGRLTHALPLPVVRVAFIVLMLWASADLLGVI